jgi:5'-nucleotidase (lipoprotein e(P4) family)
MKAVTLTSLLLAALAAPLGGQPGPASLDVKYVRDSEEYATLTRQVYRAAAGAVASARDTLQRGRVWAVVLDVDETVLDNSAYQLERQAYGLPFDLRSWNAWVRRREAGTVPGVVPFIVDVRALGGRVAWVTNRDETVREDTRANLEAHGLWDDHDRLCLQDQSDSTYVKARRRADLAAGAGRCAWEGERVAVLAYVGDQLGDFPAAGEALPGAGEDAMFGSRFFLLPNPMYGSWVFRVTRRR